MPIVHIHMLTGRPADRKKALIERVTAAVVETIEVRPEQVRVVINEVSPELWGIGGVTAADRQNVPPR